MGRGVRASGLQGVERARETSLTRRRRRGCQRGDRSEGYSHEPSTGYWRRREARLAPSRMATDSGERTTLDEVLAAFGHSRESLLDLPEDD
ncbi:hypothetical protein Pen01_41110 [Phytomonospora endophytica]|nr:hypothetical protein Pen01_41110 [Phytomonospora endophytica]